MSIWTKLAEFSTFETKRLLLRPFTFEDRDAFYQIVSNSDNLPFIFPMRANKDEALELLVEMFMKEPLGKWAIVHKESQQLIGAISFEKIKEESGQMELGYFIRKDFWGQGLASEAVQNLAFLSLYPLALREISILAHLENRASQKVAEKSGFILLRQFKGSDRYTHQMRVYRHYYLTKKLFHKFQSEREKDDHH